MSSDTDEWSSKKIGDRVEGNVVQLVPETRYVPDRKAKWHDAELVSRLEEPHEHLIFIGVDHLPPETKLEIKGAQIWYNGQRGRIYIRKRQHEKLVEEGGYYLVAVYLPKPDHPIRGMAVISAAVIDEIKTDGWTTRDRSGEKGYRQLAWSSIIKTDDIDETRH